MLFNGVRTLPTATASGRDQGRRLMAVSLRESLQVVSDPRGLDSAVDEVFQMMVGESCPRTAA